MTQSKNEVKTVELYCSLNQADSKALWVFGYGSLCWNPGFHFDKAVSGCIKGFSRKFWQGNSVHRGTEDNPGRVATLVADEKSIVYGIAFAVRDESAITYLTKRECTLGGYDDTRFVSFYPLKDNDQIANPIKVLVYIATPKNNLWLGDAPVSKIAEQIFISSGTSGHNAEYLLRLAEFMRYHFPDKIDEHLFDLEVELINHIKRHKMCVTKLMGNGKQCIVYTKPITSLTRTNFRGGGHGENRDENAERVQRIQHNSSQFQDQLPKNLLRCLRK